MILSVENVSFSYGKRRVLSDVSFTLSSSEALSLLGPNGGGKTTLFRLILNSLRPYHGRITIDGKDLSLFSKKELSHLIAYIPQVCNATFNHSVLEEVLMGRVGNINIFSTPKKEDEEVALYNLERLGIVDLKDRGVMNISGGERRLCLIARALTQNGKFLLLDEMTSNLDYGNSYKTMKIVERLKCDGYGIIFSTHKCEEAFDFSDKTLLLKDGKVLGNGKTKEVLKEDILSKLYNINVALRKENVNGNERVISIAY